MAGEQNFFNKEIDFQLLVETLKGFKKSFILIVSFFSLFGVFSAYFSPNTYTATTIFIPQDNTSSRGSRGISGLATLAGVNIGGSSSNEITPKLYPLVANSVDFKLSLSNANVVFDGEEVTYSEYYDRYNPPFNFLGFVKKHTVGLPGLLLNKLRSSITPNEKVNEVKRPNLKITKLDINNEEDFERLQSQLSIDPDQTDGYIELSFTSTDPELSAAMAEKSRQILQNVLLDFKTSKARDQLLFIEKNFKERKRDYEEAQIRLAKFKDKNRMISTAVAENGLIELESDYTLKLNIYSQLAQQLEEAKLQLNNEAPVFTTIQPVVVPLKKSGPKRVQTVILFAFVGLIFSLVYVVIIKLHSVITKEQ